jgi:MoxR-like ATPase
LQALDYHGASIPVLLIDEIDRADDEFEAFLLEILSEFSVTIPELGQISAKRVPLVVITSNRTRDVHDALKRRCLYHWISHPTLEREIDILKLKAPDVGEVLSRQVASAVQQMRSFGLFKPPGVAETIDWATALGKLGEAKLTEESLGATLGAVLKYREDQERVVSQGLNIILSAVSDA